MTERAHIQVRGDEANLHASGGDFRRIFSEVTTVLLDFVNSGGSSSSS